MKSVFKKKFGKMGISKDGGLKSGGARGKKDEKEINRSIFFCFCSFISANVANVIQGVNPNIFPAGDGRNYF